MALRMMPVETTVKLTVSTDAAPSERQPAHCFCNFQSQVDAVPVVIEGIDGSGEQDRRK